jgi:ornithine cyclodeaminase/alanine dehydrogenase-like protein (mu-crystallin family)
MAHGYVRVFSEAEVRAAVSMEVAIASARDAFVALSAGSVASPFPWALAVGDRGEIHVKGAHVHGAAYFAVKASTGFPDNATLGEPTSDGFTSVFDSATGRLAALLTDGGYLTALRTGAAGAVALDVLGPRLVDTLAVIGTGGQARHQLRGACSVRQPNRIVIVGRHGERAEALAAWVRTELAVPARASTQLSDIADADAIITVTNARRPVITAADCRVDAHITAIGSDAPGKGELDATVLHAAALIVVDDLTQSQTIGELQSTVEHPLARPAVSIGEILTSATFVRPKGITIADFSGTGAQDATIANAAALALLS